eukprot:CAMPEP_0178922558 /NCGR_PEP_ID=MMETSP0786-20121207/16225_1 /TAXON_ID=186022 /ORGANISM="Thalassionema frauenfeldii, Strain CCMP 1798" /LENGTH=357 /DNA_ID=CAMNT_0020596945 /DNA_START=33 /DNA_END=1107 /DNA_ORIENTATION=+
MTYISANGTVHAGQQQQRPIYRTHPILCGVLVAICFQNWLVGHPLSNGRIPAAKTRAEDHWNLLAKDDTLLRRLAEYLEGKENPDNQMKEDYKLRSREMKIMFDLVDFGGLDGHRYESGDFADMETFRGTRCSSTRSAVTAYFCGADVALNRNAALKANIKNNNYGVDSFREYVTCRHEEGTKTGNFTRSVFRLGIGCQEQLAGYSHAFNIIAQPDGSYLWLQSYISQYSLQQWMAQKQLLDGNRPRGKLSYDQLLAKLDTLDRIMSIDGWTDQANADYLDLFFVDKTEEAVKNGKHPIIWKDTHRLDFFTWDEACEYSLPQEEEEEEETQQSPRSDPATFVTNVMQKHLSKALKKV